MLTPYLEKKKTAILDRWFSYIVDTYPAESAGFLSKKKNQFANPVGATISKEISSLLDCLIQGSDVDSISLAMENINKIRAVQDFSASQAVAFIFFLKTAIREELKNELKQSEAFTELLSLESAIDGMALIAFDTYTHCRERLHEIKYADFKRRTALAIGGGRSRSNNE